MCIRRTARSSYDIYRDHCKTEMQCSLFKNRKIYFSFFPHFLYLPGMVFLKFFYLKLHSPWGRETHRSIETYRLLGPCPKICCTSLQLYLCLHPTLCQEWKLAAPIGHDQEQVARTNPRDVLRGENACKLQAPESSSIASLGFT